MTYSVTMVVLHKEIGGDSEAYEATISVNDTFVVQVSGNKEEASYWGITDPDVMCHDTKENQAEAYENLDSQEVEKELEKWGFENNLGWLEDHADTVF